MADLKAYRILNHGLHFQNYWREHCGYGIECLTAIEARTILRQQSFKALEIFWLKQQAKQTAEVYDQLRPYLNHNDTITRDTTESSPTLN